MSKIDQNLLDGERVVYRTQIHWCTLLAPGVLFLLLLPGTIVAAIHRFYPLVLVTAFVAVWLGVRYWLRRNSEFALTTKRVIIHLGAWSTTAFDVLLPMIGSVQVNQSFVGRALGFGSLELIATGHSVEAFHVIDDPYEFRKQIEEQIQSRLS